MIQKSIFMILLFGFNLAHAATDWQENWDQKEVGVSSRSKNMDLILGGEASAPFAPHSNNFAFDLGQVFLMGDLKEKYADSLGFQLHYTLGVSSSFGFDSSFGYSEHSDGKFSMTSLISGVRMNISHFDKIIPYFLFGLGFYKPSYKVLSKELGTSQNLSTIVFGFHLGPGVELELSKNLFFGASLIIHNTFLSQIHKGDMLPIQVGGSFGSFFLHLGYTL